MGVKRRLVGVRLVEHKDARLVDCNGSHRNRGSLVLAEKPRATGGAATLLPQRYPLEKSE